MLNYILQDVRSNSKSTSSKVQFGTMRWNAVVLFRIAQKGGQIHPLLGSVIKQLNHLVSGADIAWEAQAGEGLRLHHPTGVVIGAQAVLGAWCELQSCVTLGGRGGLEDGHPVLGNRVSVGAGARVLGRIQVGDGAKIGANAVVLHSVPAETTALGIPARWRRTAVGQVLDHDDE
jgi:serine O-acetyltransferase